MYIRSVESITVCLPALHLTSSNTDALSKMVLSCIRNSSDRNMNMSSRYGVCLLLSCCIGVRVVLSGLILWLCFVIAIVLHSLLYCHYRYVYLAICLPLASRYGQYFRYVVLCAFKHLFLYGRTCLVDVCLIVGYFPTAQIGRYTSVCAGQLRRGEGPGVYTALVSTRPAV